MVCVSNNRDFDKLHKHFFFLSQLEHVLSSEDFWTGLKNPNKQACYDSCCINKLIWDSDGSILNSWADTNPEIVAPSGDECLRYYSTYLNDVDCTALYDYICEFDVVVVVLVVLVVVVVQVVVVVVTVGFPRHLILGFR